MLRVLLGARAPVINISSRIRLVGFSNGVSQYRNYHSYQILNSDRRGKKANTLMRFYSSKSDLDPEENKKEKKDAKEEKASGKEEGLEEDHDEGERNLTLGDIMNNSESELKEVNKYPSGLPQLVGNPQGRPPEMPLPEFMINKPAIDYKPQDEYERVTYEFHVPPSPTQRDNAFYIKRYFRERWWEFIPMALMLLYGSWMIFAWKFVNPPDKEDEELLSPTKFLPYIITYKEKLDNDWYLIEVTRRRRMMTLVNTAMKGRGLFDGESMWSVEVKQPEINIVRNLTPIPVYIPGVNPKTKEPHFRLVDSDIHDGRFVFLVKRYEQGEFSRWFTNLNLLSEVELRGPVVEYKFPAHPLDRQEPRPQMYQVPAGIKIDPKWPDSVSKPNDFVFFGAGTGIAPILQVLLSPNPPKGFVDAYVSLPSETCLPPQFKTLNYFMEKAGRAKFHYIFSDHGERLDLDYIPRPSLPRFSGAYDKVITDQMYKQGLLEKKKAEVQSQIQQPSLRERVTDFFNSNVAVSGDGTDGGDPHKMTKKQIANLDKKEEEEMKSGKKLIDLDEDNKDEFIPTTIDINFDPRIFPSNAILEQERKKILEKNEEISIWGKLYGKVRLLKQKEKTTGNTKSECSGEPSLAIVCGPEGYVTDVSGKPDLNNLQGVDTGPIGGYLKQKGWDLKNVKRLY